jgi:hypothetical protein
MTRTPISIPDRGKKCPSSAPLEDQTVGRVKAVGAQSCPLATKFPGFEYVEPYLHFAIHPNGVVLNEAQKERVSSRCAALGYG